MNEPQMKLPGFITVIALVGLFALFAWMGERDYQHQIEMAQLRSEVARLSAEVEPTIELSMPIERTKL